MAEIKSTITSQNTGAEAITTNNERGGLEKVRPITNRLKHRQQAYLIALEKTFCNVSQASVLTNINRSCHHAWMHKYPDYAKKVADMNVISLEFVRSKMFQKINEGSDSMIQFFLRNKDDDFRDDGKPKFVPEVHIHETRLSDEDMKD